MPEAAASRPHDWKIPQFFGWYRASAPPWTKSTAGRFSPAASPGGA